MNSWYSLWLYVKISSITEEVTHFILFQRCRVCFCKRMDEDLLWTAWIIKSSQESYQKSHSEHFWLYCKSYWVSWFNACPLLHTVTKYSGDCYFSGGKYSNFSTFYMCRHGLTNFEKYNNVFLVNIGHCTSEQNLWTNKVSLIWE